jgi:hypothetical protein
MTMTTGELRYYWDPQSDWGREYLGVFEKRGFLEDRQGQRATRDNIEPVYRVMALMRVMNKVGLAQAETAEVVRACWDLFPVGSDWEMMMREFDGW